MRSKTLILTLFSLVFLNTACEKEYKNLRTAVSGRIVTAGTDNYPGEGPMTVYLSEFEAVSIFGGGYTIIDSTKTDENGNYHFAFTAENDYDKFKVGLNRKEKPPLHHLSSSQIASTGAGYTVVTGKVQTINFELGAFAWVKITVTNINPVFGDHLHISWDSSQKKDFYGPVVNDQVLFFGAGNATRSFPLTLYRNDDVTIWRDTVQMVAFDTTYHRIEY